MQQYDGNYNMMAQQSSQQSSRQRQQQQQQQQSQRQQQQQQQQTQLHGSPQQQHSQTFASSQQQQQNERSRQHQQMNMNQANYYSTSNQSLANLQNMIMAGQEHQSSPMAFQWPPNGQQQQQQRGPGDDSVFNELTFPSNNYYDSSQADAEIDAILSNYQPKLYSNMQQSNLGVSSQSMSNASQHGSQTSHTGMTGLLSDQLDPVTAAAAAAAYGHLGYGSMNRLEDGSSGSSRSDLDQWSNSQSQQSGRRANTGGAGLDFQTSSYSGSGKGTYSGTNYDGDASNASSSQTPGGISSGDDSTGGKRRRMTVGGGVQALEQQERYEAGMSTGGTDGKGASAAQSKNDRPVMQHHSNSVIDSRRLEQMAQESLHRASQDNARALSSNASANPNRLLQPTRPNFRHRRSFSGSHIPQQSPSISTAMIPAADDSALVMTKGQSGPAPPHASSTSQLSSYPNISMSGHAASHPPGMGSQVLRGTDGGTSGINAATDFTKRKGWPTRIVEELLDFVHVLDRKGHVLFASPSVLTLTGWRAEELKGKELTEFVHPDDVLSVRREFQNSLKNRTELTMYYRFRRKPQTAADKQRVRDQREAQHVSRSRSGSTSGGDSSSNQDVVNANNNLSTFATGSMDNQFLGGRPGYVDEEGDLQDDSQEKYVIFEAIGHPYISPEGSLESELSEEHIEKIFPEVVSGGLLANIKDEFSSGIMDGRGPLDKGGGGATNEIQCFFCSCRIYPTKNVGMLDSFLELKLENERLRTLLGELSVSEAPGTAATGGDGGSDGRTSFDESQAGYHLDYLQDNEKSTLIGRQSNYGSNNVLPGHYGVSDKNLSNNSNSQISYRKDSSISTGSGPTSNPTSPHLSQSLERSTTGGTSGQGLAEDSDVETSPNPSSQMDEKKKKKKPKPEDGDYVCTDCGRVDSPEWRKGPLGPKTLCNACGLRWAKKIKRNGGDPNAIAMAARPAKGQIKAQAAAARAQKQNLQFQKENGDLTQSGPPPLNSNNIMSPIYANQQQQQHQSPQSPQFDSSFSNLYGESSLNQMNNQDFLDATGMSFDPNMQHLVQSDYSQSS